MIALALAVSFLTRRRRPDWSATEELAALLRIGLVLALLLPVHFLLKSFIHLINSRTWDLRLAAWDQRIHLGVSPGRFLVALLPSPALLRAVDVFYSGAYFFLVLAYTAIAFGRLPIRRKLVFAAALVIAWTAGTVLYLAFPTWGPVFVFPDDFRAALDHMPLTVSVQKILYSEVSSLVTRPLEHRKIMLGSVAAFPSMHLAEVTLLALASRPISRTWFRWNLGVVAAMFVGSILTGYHYAIDGYAGIALALLSWAAGSRMYPPDRTTAST